MSEPSRSRLYAKGDYIGTIHPERGPFRWTVTDLTSLDRAKSNYSGLAVGADLAWECCNTVVVELMQARES